MAGGPSALGDQDGAGPRPGLASVRAGCCAGRAVAAELGPIAYVLTSTAPRAIETAVAMGVAVDDTAELPSGYVPGEVGFHEQWTWAQPWVRYAELLARGGGLAAVAEAHRAAWIRAVASVAEGASALVVSHGGTIEPTLVTCLPRAGHQRWGALLGHCDGVRLGFQGGSVVDLCLRRAPTMPAP